MRVSFMSVIENPRFMHVNQGHSRVIERLGLPAHPASNVSKHFQYNQQVLVRVTREGEWNCESPCQDRTQEYELAEPPDA